MNYDLAPMEGITTYIYRTTYAKYYGGIDRCYTPFLASMHLSTREKNEVLPEHNAGITVIPQILSKRADEFLAICGALQVYGYDTVNLNLGCPSGTVVAKHRGAGFLAVPDELDRFLDEIFSSCPLKISIKTRIGIADESEWEDILRVYERYPVDELIIHTRLQKDFYRQPARPHTYPAAKRLGIPLCYNGDVNSPAALQHVLSVDPSIDRIMIGRGIIANPELLEALRGEPACDKARLQSFLSDICDRYLTEMDGGDRNTLYKLKELWVYMAVLFPDSEKYIKRIKKANRLTEYHAAVDALMREKPLQTDTFSVY